MLRAIRPDAKPETAGNGEPGTGSGRLRRRLASGHLAQGTEDAQPVLPRDLDHEVRALRRPTHAEDAVASRKQALRDGMEDFVEALIADATRSGERDQGQGEPLADDGTCPARKSGSA